MVNAFQYPGFPYQADQIVKFLCAMDLFTFLLKDENIVHYTPDNPDAFKKWLKENNIQSIKEVGQVSGI